MFFAYRALFPLIIFYFNLFSTEDLLNKNVSNVSFFATTFMNMQEGADPLTGLAEPSLSSLSEVKA